MDQPPIYYQQKNKADASLFFFIFIKYFPNNEKIVTFKGMIYSVYKARVSCFFAVNKIY